MWADITGEWSLVDAVVPDDGSTRFGMDIDDSELVFQAVWDGDGPNIEWDNGTIFETPASFDGQSEIILEDQGFLPSGEIADRVRTWTIEWIDRDTFRVVEGSMELTAVGDEGTADESETLPIVGPPPAPFRPSCMLTYFARGNHPRQGAGRLPGGEQDAFASRKPEVSDCQQRRRSSVRGCTKHTVSQEIDRWMTLLSVVVRLSIRLLLAIPYRVLSHTVQGWKVEYLLRGFLSGRSRSFSCEVGRQVLPGSVRAQVWLVLAFLRF